MDGRGVCPSCGSPELLRADGAVRHHRTLRMGRNGVWRSAEVCDGTGQQPEREPVEATTAAGGA